MNTLRSLQIYLTASWILTAFDVYSQVQRTADEIQPAESTSAEEVKSAGDQAHKPSEELAPALEEGDYLLAFASDSGIYPRIETVVIKRLEDGSHAITFPPLADSEERTVPVTRKGERIAFSVHFVSGGEIFVRAYSGTWADHEGSFEGSYSTTTHVSGVDAGHFTLKKE